MNLRIPLLLLIACVSVSTALAQAGRIYTKPDAEATGALVGRVGEELTHAIAVEHDRVRVYRAELSDGGRTFLF